MLISLVLGYKKCFMCIYLERLIFGVKIKLRNTWAYKWERRTLLLGVYGMTLRFRFKSIYFDNNEDCYTLLNKFILSSAAERIK